VRFLRELVRGRVEFMVVGLSAAALQGAPVVTQDVDLWFRDLEDSGLRKALKKVGASYLPSGDSHLPVLVGDAVELFDIVVHMHGLGGFRDEMRNAVRVSLGSFKVPVLPLERVIASKRALGRNKDKLYLKVLEDARKAIRRAG
jgi:hypothetical protein